MTTLNRKEAPARPPSKSGASSNREGYVESSPHTSSIPLALPAGNKQLDDPVVQAIRILARRGRQLREQAERAAAVHDQTEQRVETADVDQSNDHEEQTADTMAENAHQAFGLRMDVDSTDGRCCDGR